TQEVQDALPKHVEPVLLSADIRKKAEAINRVCRPILSKPKPTPPKPEQTKINNFMVQELDGTVNEWVGARRSLVQMLYYQCHLLCATQEHKLKKFFITRRAVTENVPKSVVEINTGGQGPLNNPLSSRLAILNLAIPDFLIAHNLVLARLIKV
nr:heat shock 70 kDa protein 15-like [Tanacetum cinerariifolium]